MLAYLDEAGLAEHRQGGVPEDMQGRSMLPLLQGKMPEDWREFFDYHYYEYPVWHSTP